MKAKPASLRKPQLAALVTLILCPVRTTGMQWCFLEAKFYTDPLRAPPTAVNLIRILAFTQQLAWRSLSLAISFRRLQKTCSL